MATAADRNRFDVSEDKFKEQSWKTLVPSYPLQTQRWGFWEDEGIWCHDHLKSRDITLWQPPPMENFLLSIPRVRLLIYHELFDDFFG